MKRMVDANIFTKANGDVVINDGMEVNTNGDVTVSKDLHVKGKINGGVQSTPVYIDNRDVTFSETYTANNELYFKRFGNVVTCYYSADISGQTNGNVKLVDFAGSGLEEFLPDQGEKYFIYVDEAGTPGWMKIDNTGITLDFTSYLSGNTVYACWTYIKEE